jgi:hypothetical protein
LAGCREDGEGINCNYNNTENQKERTILALNEDQKEQTQNLRADIEDEKKELERRRSTLNGVGNLSACDLEIVKFYAVTLLKKGQLDELVPLDGDRLKVFRAYGIQEK